jgi:xanthine dehydrogenase iron-sulfur cluster and FAD-binding subunit A
MPALLPRLVSCGERKRDNTAARRKSSQGVCMAIQFTLNGKAQRVDVDPQMPLLWVLRDTLNLTGTKFGCGMAL